MKMVRFLNKILLGIMLGVALSLFGVTGTVSAATSDDASDFVMVSEYVPDAILEVRYFTTYNFVGDRIDGYEEPIVLCTKEAAAALRKASDALRAQGYRLKIYDGYRPQMAVDNFVRWAKD
ncbi:MAG: peptidase M15, partial [Selenomonadaceae bacterium]|nr:peptidase M15 [Selenomonadaceae bacterium]